MKKIMIIDGSSLLYRAFFALPPLNNALGVPTNAVYGFLTMLIKLYHELNPDYVVVAFDKGKETFRTELYSEYKANRSSAPPELISQFGLIREVLEALGIRVIEEIGFEGDDIIGSLSKQLGAEGLSVNIITGDRDTLQLVNEHSSVFLTKKGISDMLEVTVDNMESLYGYGPELVVEIKSLMGDSSDNIPGVPGVGEKTALKLLSEYKTLEGIYANIDMVSGKKLKEKLVENKELAFLSRVLATIKTDMDISYEMSDFVPAIHEQEVYSLFETLGFHNLVPKLQHAFNLSGDSAFDNLFSHVEVDADVDLITAQDVLSNISKVWKPTDFVNKTVGVYLQTEGNAPFFTLIKAFIAIEGNDKAVLVVDGNSSKEVGFLREILSQASAICVQDGKKLFETLGKEKPFKLTLTASIGNLLPTVTDFSEDEIQTNTYNLRVWDLTLMAYLLDPTRTNYGITYLCERFEEKTVRADGSAQEFASTALAFLHMHNKAEKAMIDKGLIELYAKIELPLIYTLAVIEKNGIYINPVALDEMKERFIIEVEGLQKEIYEIAGEEFNINSPKQLGIILFEKLGLDPIKKTKTGYSTDAEVLDILRWQSPIVEKILAYRTVVKLLSTYLEGLKPLINEETKRIHSSFNQMVTATGRLSSSEPNLQNIPVRTEKGKQIRSLFLPGDGYDYLVSADYSQIELRILAHLSEDPALIKAFTEGLDIHRFTAAEVLNKGQSEVTSEERSQAKAVNFGIIYGISDFGLARDLGITREAAKDYITLYFNRYPKIKEYMDRQIAYARETGEVRTMLGRVRTLPEIKASNFNRRSFAERTAMNTPIQGSAADIIKMAMNAVESWLEKEQLTSRILLQVHDELVLEVTESELELVERNLKRIMEAVIELKVPLVVDVHNAKNWALVK